MLQRLNCHWGHLHEKFSRGERHQLILSQLFSRDALWPLPWHPVTGRDQRLAMELNSCELKKGNCCSFFGQNCHPMRRHQQDVHRKNHPTLTVTLIIIPHRHIEYRKAHSFPGIIQPCGFSQIGATKASLAFCWDGWRVALRPSSLASFLRSASP